MTPADPLAFAAAVGAILEKVGIRYVIGGSVAASLYGEPRSTLDVDIMIEADEEAVRALVVALSETFYVDEDAAVEAVRHVSTFNAVHLASAMKVDFFLAEDDPAVRVQLTRRRAVSVGDRLVWFYAIEDILVRKLRWFRMGGEQSDRQWRDVIGLLRGAGEGLDRAYLDRAAEQFGVVDLLARAQRDALL